MPLPPQIDEQIRAQFQSLITQLQAVANTDYTLLFADTYQATKHTVSFHSLKTNSLSLLQILATKGDHIAQMMETVRNMDDGQAAILLGILTGLKKDYESGMLINLAQMIEANVTADYLEQAERLLSANKKGEYNHVPAAVLAGAVLEDSLRRLCNRQMPPIPVTKPGGSPKMLNALIDDLKNAGFINELKAKQLRSWADIRNAAAHGHFDEFTRSDTEQMLTGVHNFLSDYL